MMLSVIATTMMMATSPVLAQHKHVHGESRLGAQRVDPIGQGTMRMSPMNPSLVW